MHRKNPVASPEHRLAMVKCAVMGEPAFYADDREIRRKGATYTIDTLLDIKREMPDIPLCLFIGIDAFLNFTSWHRWKEILLHSHIIIAHRPQYQLPLTGIIADLIKENTKHESSFVHENMSGAILLRPVTAFEISATEIRKQIAMGKNPRYLLPDSVYDYIKEYSIYSMC
jgi:nicotinate-nucleotide adenylyltransferase